MFETLTALAAASSTSTGFSPVTLFLPIVLIGGLYFLLIRPQRRQQQQQRQLAASLDVGDEVMTTSGMIGTIIEMDDETVILEIADGVEVRFVRQAISRKFVYEDDQQDDEAYDEDEDDTGKDDSNADAAHEESSPNGQGDDGHKGPWFDAENKDKPADETKGAGGET